MFSQSTPFLIVLLILVLIWSFTWKGIALWKAARNGQKTWFAALLVLNTLGLLEIVYVLGFSKKEDKKISV